MIYHIVTEADYRSGNDGQQYGPVRVVNPFS